MTDEPRRLTVCRDGLTGGYFLMVGGYATISPHNGIGGWSTPAEALAWWESMRQGPYTVVIGQDAAEESPPARGFCEYCPGGSLDIGGPCPVHEVG